MAFGHIFNPKENFFSSKTSLDEAQWVILIHTIATMGGFMIKAVKSVLLVSLLSTSLWAGGDNRQQDPEDQQTGALCFLIPNPTLCDLLGGLLGCRWNHVTDTCESTLENEDDPTQQKDPSQW